MSLLIFFWGLEDVYKVVFLCCGLNFLLVFGIEICIFFVFLERSYWLEYLEGLVFGDV